MTLTTIIVFAVTELFLCLIPGPAVLLVLSQGILHGVKKSTTGVIGILTGNIIYFSLSAVGLGAILVASKSLFFTIRIAGAIYLCYLGIQIIRHAKQPTIKKFTTSIYSNRRLYSQGLLTQLANPKAILLFTSLYPQFINVNKPAIEQFAILGAISILIEFPVLVGYAWLAERSKKVFRDSKLQPYFNRLAGVFLIGAGLRLLTLKNGA